MRGPGRASKGGFASSTSPPPIPGVLPRALVDGEALGTGHHPPHAPRYPPLAHDVLHGYDGQPSQQGHGILGVQLHRGGLRRLRHRATHGLLEVALQQGDAVFGASPARGRDGRRCCRHAGRVYVVIVPIDRSPDPHRASGDLKPPRKRRTRNGVELARGVPRDAAAVPRQKKHVHGTRPRTQKLPSAPDGSRCSFFFFCFQPSPCFPRLSRSFLFFARYFSQFFKWPAIYRFMHRTFFCPSPVASRRTKRVGARLPARRFFPPPPSPFLVRARGRQKKKTKAR